MLFQESFQEQKNIFTILWEEFVARHIFLQLFVCRYETISLIFGGFFDRGKIGHAAVVIIFLFKRWKVYWDGRKWDLDLMLHVKNGMSQWTNNSRWLDLSGASSIPVQKDSITYIPWLSYKASLLISGVRMTLLTTKSIVTSYTKSYT